MTGTTPSSQPASVRPEHALLLASAVAGVASTRPSIDALLSAALDWTLVVELALEHRMAAALLAALETASPALVPPDILEALRAHCDQLRHRSDALVAELFSLLDALERASVIAVPFKGPLLGELLFGDIGARAPGDIDILVGRGDVTRVCQLLEERGYVDAGGAPLTATQHDMYRRIQCQYMFVRSSDGAVVEPHWGLTQHPLAVDADYAGMLSRARPRRLAGHTVLTLAPDDLLIALCIHGSKHHWERLAWIRDVSALLGAFPEIDLEACVDRARSRGCRRLLLVGLAVARRCAGARLPPAIERIIEADRVTLALERQVVERLFDRGKPSPRHDRIDRFRFLVRERWIDRTRYVARTWLSPGRNHIEKVALPQSFRWAYFPLKGFYDYVAMPLWRLVRPATHRRTRT